MGIRKLAAIGLLAGIAALAGKAGAPLSCCHRGAGRRLRGHRMPRSNRIAMVIALVVAVPLGEGAFATDGVLEINQTCAVQTGCFPGDISGFVVTINAPGSYRLTSNLVLPNENSSGVQVNAPNVSIDLNGFSILRSGCEAGCSQVSGAGTGIGVGIFPASGASVRNGSIIGMGSWGVVLDTASACEVRNLRVGLSGIEGIRVGNNSIVSENAVYGSGEFGIHALGSVVTGNSLQDNGDSSGDAGIVAVDSTISGNRVINSGGDAGIQASASTILGNTVLGSAGLGIWATTGSIVQQNTVSNSGDTGIRADASSTIVGNTVNGSGGAGINASASTIHQNTVSASGSTGIVASASTISGNTVFDNTGRGINATNGSSLQQNTVRDNTLFGLSLVDSAYRENTISNNAGGTVSGGINLGDNSCNGAATCP